MALKDLLVHVDDTDAALVRLQLAIDLARRHSSHVAALYVKELSLAQLHQRSTAELGLASLKQLDRLYESQQVSIDRAAARVQMALADLGRSHSVKVEWRCVSGSAAVAVLQHARYADLTVLGHGAGRDSIEYTFSEQLLFVTGRPMLFVPAVGSFRTLGRHIMVAWNSSRAAARAVNDARALIERAERTTVLAVNPTDFIDRHGAQPIEWMVEHLRRHGACVDLLQLENIPTGSIGDALQTEARALGADLIVAGAFGYPKLWEKLLGGVTCDLLARMTMPILMSH
jgi:nucleotide-binding universal stress UspA family protein